MGLSKRGRARLSLAALVFVLVSCAQEPRSVPGAIPTAPTPSPAAAGEGSSSPLVSNPPPSGERTPVATPLAVEGTPEGPEASGITLATPVLLEIGDRKLPAVLATNTANVVRGFTVSATWTRDGAVVATARGAAQDVLPGEQRAVNLSSETAIPDGATGEAHVDRVLPPPPAEVGQIAAAVRFGRTVINRGAVSSVETQVTNSDAETHSFSVGAALLAKGVLIGTAGGAIPNIGPRLTLPVSMPIAGSDAGYDQILLYVETVNS